MEALEEIKKIGSDLDTKYKTVVELSKQTDEKSQKALEEIKKEIESGRKEQGELIKKQQEHLDALETKMKKGELEVGVKKSFDQELADQFKGKESDFAQLKEGKVKGLSFEIKAAANLLLGTNYTGSVGLTTWDSEWSRPLRRQPFLRQLVTTRPVNSMYIAYAEMKNRDGAATGVLEGGVKPLIDFDIVEASKKVEKIAAVMKTSKEALADIAGLRAEINTELVEAVNIELDRQLLSGTGTSPEISGIITLITSAISVVGTPFATGVDDPNNFDVLRVAAAMVAQNFFNPNYAILNPLDAAAMELVKDANGNYVLPPFSTANGQIIGGLRIVTNQAMTLGNFLVGDFSKDILGIREEINIQVGYENDDFRRNLVTILAEMRAVNYIKSNNLGAFVRGTFATVRTAITAA